MELPVKPQILTSYIHIYIYKLSCGTVVCKHFASYQGLMDTSNSVLLLPYLPPQLLLLDTLLFAFDYVFFVQPDVHYKQIIILATLTTLSS
jgi:hypothetical protein